ncbi:MAG TPA: sigma-70 family RNA polymerase sigma factor [Solirubrobacteraceae bacterium]|nr:sigma-70 family RNA polymerase sigma factor [Solirubrobacteraceae bacterium]
MTDAAFEQLIADHRRELLAHCYRMLGSPADAEDALQDAMLRAWRALPKFEGRSSLRTWLYRITTNTCLRALERRPRDRVLPIDYGPPADPHDRPATPLVESVWIEPFPDDQLAVDAAYEQREAIELAFIAALQHLPARQRAVLILRDVLGFSAREVAESLETTPVSIDSALQRAHKAVDQRMPERTQQATLRALGDEAVRAAVDRYRDAWERADVDAVKAMLAEDAIVAMPPHPTWYEGRDAIGEFLRRLPFRAGRHERVVPTAANGQLAFAHYWSLDGDPFTLHAIGIVSFRGTEIAELTYFRSPEVLARFDLPATVD